MVSDQVNVYVKRVRSPRGEGRIQLKPVAPKLSLEGARKGLLSLSRRREEERGGALRLGRECLGMLWVGLRDQRMRGE